jgi:hypothetical protein
MTSGVKTRLESILRRMLLAAVMAAAWPAHALELDALMALLAQRKSGEARFTEERIVSGFDTPLRASGKLAYAVPDRFARFTETPRAESMEVDGNTLILRRGGRTRQTTLDAMPEMLALTDAIRGTLGGDAQLLKKHFRIDVGGTRERWTLKLTPLEGGLLRAVRELEIAGQGPDVRTIEMWLAGGDRSVMQVEPLVPGPWPRRAER